MTLKSLVQILVLVVLVVLGSFVWNVQRRGRAARVDYEGVSAIRTPEGDDLRMRKDFHDELLRDLEEERFKELDRIAGELTVEKSRFPGGDWKLMRFYEDVAYPSPGYVMEAVDWPKRLALLEKWTREMPNSVFAVIALGEGTIGYAWGLRGRGFGNEISTESFNRFQHGLDQAERILNRVSDRRKTCVAWYRSMQSIGLGKGWELQRMESLLDEAISVEPLYLDIFTGHAVYLLPRWHGSPGDWQKFADRCASRVGGVEGAILYADICWQMSRFIGVKELYGEEHIPYPRIREGFIKRTQRYGASYRYLNAFCLLAGTAGDIVTTRALMARIGDHWEPDFWEDKSYFDAYKKWAAQ